MNIIENFGSLNLSNCNNRTIKYIVIHYTAGATSKTGAANANAEYYKSANRGASADFFVDDSTIVQYNPDLRNHYSGHCGGSKKSTQGGTMYGIVTNFNSIGIEICSTNKTGKITYANDSNFYFTEDTLNLAIELTKYLMNKYSIDIDHVVRHYDVTGKLCPGIIGWNLDSGDESRWFAFKQRLINQEEDEDMTQDKFNELMNNYIEQLANSDATWETNEMNWAQQNGLINGDNLGRTMPKKYLTRGELAAVLMRFKDKFIG